jgi:ferrous iron transport protein A
MAGGNERTGVSRTLDDLSEGEESRIVRIGGHGAIRRRLMDMGVTRGTSVLLKRRAPLGDPLQIEVKGYDLAIRKAEARYIEVETAANEQPGLDVEPPRDPSPGTGTSR